MRELGRAPLASRGAESSQAAQGETDRRLTEQEIL